jgi:hypothetical protein
MPACRPCMIRHNTIGLRHYLTHVWDLWYIELVQTIQEKKMNKIEITFLEILSNGTTTIEELSPVFSDSAAKRQVVVSADDLDEVRETIEWLKRTADSYHITTS